MYTSANCSIDAGQRKCTYASNIWKDKDGKLHYTFNSTFNPNSGFYAMIPQRHFQMPSFYSMFHTSYIISSKRVQEIHDLNPLRERPRNHHNGRSHQNGASPDQFPRARSSTGGNATTRPVVRDVVIFCRDLEDRAAAHVVVIHVQELGRVPPVIFAVLRSEAQRSVPGDVVGDVQKRDVGNKESVAQKRDLVIEVVVCKVETIFCVCGAEARWPLRGARE